MAAPSLLPVDAFFEALARSNLLSAEQTASTRLANSRFPDAKSAALALIAQGLITRWQAGQLLAGRQALFLGKYKLLDKIGSGGMGAVYRAELPDGRIAAIKVMNKNLLAEPEALRRFLREARAAAALSHPNVVAWIDHGQIGPTHYLAMEYVRGRDLSAWIDDFGRLPIDWSCECIRQAALGLQHAHERGMVHRDIKPSNILVAAGDAGSMPIVKILDLGLARFPHADGEHSELTKTGQIMGTPDYMSVEQAENTKSADIRSDIFSLGCTLFKLLTGELPYKGDTAMEKLIARVKYDAPLVSRYRPEVPHALAEIVARMLAREPKDRFQTPAEVAAALAPYSIASEKLDESSSCLQLKAASQVSASLDAMPDPGLADIANQLGSQAQSLVQHDQPAESEGAGPQPPQPARLMPPARRGPAPSVAAAPQAPAPVPVAAAPWPSREALAAPVEAPLESPSVFNPEASTVPGLGEGSSWRSQLRAMPRALIFAVVAGMLLLGMMAYAMTRPGASPVRTPGDIAATNAPSATPTGSEGRVESNPTRSPTPPPNSSAEPARAIAPFNADQARGFQDAWAKYLNVDREAANSIGMRLVLIPPGEFDMGSRPVDAQMVRQATEQLPNRQDAEWLLRSIPAEEPVHRVRITQPFYIGKLETTQEEYRQLVPQAVFLDARAGHPADNTTWLEAVTFCNALSTREERTPYYTIDGRSVSIVGGGGYRLPTEAEWEFACRAGTETPWYFGSLADPRTVQANSWVNKHGPAGSHTRAGMLAANPFGLHDMVGNAWEWCWDQYLHAYYTDQAQVDPLGPGGDSASRPNRMHVLRGGGYAQSPLHGRSATRLQYGVVEAAKNKDCGFRVVRSAGP